MVQEKLNEKREMKNVVILYKIKLVVSESPGI
jgi:hypothetical protein